MDDQKKTEQALHLYQLMEKNYRNNVIITFGIYFLYENIHIDFRNNYDVIISKLIYMLLEKNKKCSYHITNDPHLTYFEDRFSDRCDMQHTVDAIIIEMMEYFRYEKIKRGEELNYLFRFIPVKYSYKEIHLIMWKVIQELFINSIT